MTLTPEANDSRKHLSVSQLDMLSRCGQQWAYRYLDGLIMPPGFALLKGKAVHAAAEANFRQKLTSRVDLPRNDIRDIAVASFESECTAGYALDEESGVSPRGQIDAAKDETAALGDAHAALQAPAYQPVLVEARFRINLPGPTDLVGVIDLASEAGEVVDFKNVSKAISQADADNSMQLTAYAAALPVLTGSPATAIKLDSLVARKSGIDRHELFTARGSGDFAALAARVNAANSVIESGTFMPAVSGGFGSPCSWCGYRRICPYVSPIKKG